jgi:hypothetical protein
VTFALRGLAYLLASVAGGLLIWRSVVMADRVRALREVRGESFYGPRPDRRAAL